MTVYAFFLTYLVGGFTMTPAFIYVFFKCEERRDAKAKAKRIHPSNQPKTDITFVPDILS